MLLNIFCRVRQIIIKYKQYIQEKCQQRHDELGNQVLFQTEAIVNDVVASDVRYHKDCKTAFFLRVNDEYEENPQDKSLLKVIKLVMADSSHIWNTVELYDVYTTDIGEVLLECKSFVNKLICSFNDDFISFHARGYAKLLCFKDHVRGILKIAKENDDCDDGVETVGRTINAECKNVKIDTENYDTHIDLEVAMESVSDTLQHLLECVSPTFHHSLYSALIGNIVTSIVQTEQPVSN